jgi:serine/threonine protein phosphatase 1
MFSFGRKVRQGGLPDGAVVYAIGDIHGRADLLERLIDLIDADVLERAPEAAASAASSPTVIALGDYVDRGPDSARVIDLLLGLRERYACRFLMGNHEQAMREFLKDPVAMRAWLIHGGVDTLASYGVRPPAMSSDHEAVHAALQEAADALARAIPGAHRAFYEQLEPFVLLGDYLFVHAGVDPEKALEAQTEADLFWIRSRFLRDSRKLPFTVVHGHTVVEAPFQDARRIAVDTGAYATGVLTAARFDASGVAFLSARATRR